MLSAIKTKKTRDDHSELKEDPAWFQNTIIANSPAGDVLVIAAGTKAVFLTSRSYVVLTYIAHY